LDGKIIETHHVNQSSTTIVVTRFTLHNERTNHVRNLTIYLKNIL